MTDRNAPQNELEAALFAAAADAAARPHFYRVLAESSVLIAHVGDPPALIDGVVREETKLSLPSVEIQGKMHIPFFSSEARMEPGTRYLGMKALDLFTITKGSHLVLNPGSDFGKLFLPKEISDILDGSLFAPTETFVAKKGTQQLIGQPKDYPHAFVDAISRFMAGEPTIESAFIAQHFIAGTHAEPALLVAVTAPDGDFERLAAAIGIISRETEKAQDSVDIVRLDSGARGYFADQKPFYVRKKRGFLSKLFG